MKSFFFGALAYPFLEIIHRGRTHPSMALAGGLGMLALKRCRRLPLPWFLRAFCGALSITGIEYAAGLLFNRRHHIWDYRKQKGHLQGQICPAFFGVWLFLSFFFTMHIPFKRP